MGYKPAHKPAPYHEEAYDAPAVYKYGYAVADDYSGASFSADEGRDGYATTGSYRVALPTAVPRSLPTPSPMPTAATSPMCSMRATPPTPRLRLTSPPLPTRLLLLRTTLKSLSC